MSPVTHVLVAGGGSFIAPAFVRQVLCAHPAIQVTLLDRVHPGHDQSIADALDDGRFAFVMGDAGDARTVRRLADAVDSVVTFPGAGGTRVLLDAAVATEHRRFLQVSIGADASPEALLREYRERFGLPTVLTRVAHPYGPYQSPAETIPRFIINALLGLPLAVGGDGSGTAAHLHVDDVAAAVAVVLDRGTPGLTYAVGGNEPVTELRLADTVLRLCERPAFLKVFVPADHRTEPFSPLSDVGAQQLGWSQRIAFDDGMRSTVDWYRHHEHCWMRGRTEVA